MSQKNKKRILYWDNIKGLLILLVVFAHFLYDLQENASVDLVVDLIYFFHMPAFVFTAGYFSKSLHSRNEESLIKLIAAYLILNGLFILLDVYKGNLQPHMLTAYKSEWFLFALVVWRVIAPRFSRFKYCFIISLFIAVVAGFWDNIGGESVLAVSKVVTFLPFFMAGFLLSPEKANILRTRSGLNFRTLFGLLSIIIGLSFSVVSRSMLNITDRHLLPGSYSGDMYTDMIIRMIIFLISFLMILGLILLSPDKKLPLLTKIGRNSLSIYLIHRPLTLLFSRFAGDLPAVLIMVIAAVLTLATVLIFGSDRVSGIVNEVLSSVTASVLRKESDKTTRIITILFWAFMILIFLSPVIMRIILSLKG